MHKTPLIIANWKSHKVMSEARQWMAGVQSAPVGVECVVAPPFTFVALRPELPAGWTLGAQDVSPFPLGAYTGAIAATQLADAGVTFCLVGHSERRRYFHETNQDVANKCEQLITVGIRPVVCVDAPYAKEQLDLLESSQIHSNAIDIAYEPLSAIGTGDAADPAKEVATIREIQSAWPESRVLYGGSVNADNVGEYLLIADGVLIATACLEANSMNAILEKAAASGVLTAEG